MGHMSFNLGRLENKICCFSAGANVHVDGIFSRLLDLGLSRAVVVIVEEEGKEAFWLAGCPFFCKASSPLLLCVVVVVVAAKGRLQEP